MTDPQLVMLGQLVAGQQSPDEVPGQAWAWLARRALHHGLGPMLFWRLKQDGYDVAANPDLRPLIQNAHVAAMHYALLEASHREVNAALQAAAIPALWLKGSALARRIYPEPALRIMGDLDVLVPYTQREQALKLVQGLGYDFYMMNSLKMRSSGDEMTQRLSHHYHLKGGIANNIILELHYRVLRYNDEVVSLDDLRWFWDHTQTLRLDDGATFDTLAPEAHLLYLCAHALLQHGEAQIYLLRFFDMHQMITQIALDWDLTVNQAVALGWTAAVERALRLCQLYFATPVPDAILEALVKRRPAHEDASRLVRLSGAGNRWERVRDHLGDLSPRERVAYVRLVAFPTRSYMRERYHIAPGKPVWPHYLPRWFDQGRDVLSSFVNRITGRYRRAR